MTKPEKKKRIYYKNMPKAYVTTSFILTLVAMLLRVICLSFFYDREIGYFESGALPTIFAVLCVLAVVFFATAFYFVEDNKNRNGYAFTEERIPVRISSGIAVVAFGLFFATSVFSTILLEASTLFDLLSKLSALMAIAYFGINIFSSAINRKMQTLLGFGVMIWSIYVIAMTYSDIYVQLNSPDKIMIHLALISIMFFFIAEFRGFVGEHREPFYVFSLCLSVFFSGVEAVPSLMNVMESGLKGYEYFAYDLVIFSLFIYTFSRLIEFVFVNKPMIVAQDESSADDNTAVEE